MRWDRGIFNGSNANRGWVVGKFILFKAGFEIEVEKRDLNLKQLLWGNDGICHQHLKEHPVFPRRLQQQKWRFNQKKKKHRGYFTWI